MKYEIITKMIISTLEINRKNLFFTFHIPLARTFNPIKTLKKHLLFRMQGNSLALVSQILVIHFCHIKIEYRHLIKSIALVNTSPINASRFRRLFARLWI